MKRIDYLKNLDKWYASSHPELADAKPETLFELGFVEKYLRLHSDLWWRIIRVHGTLYTLGELKEFPFDHLYPPNGMEFWRLRERYFAIAGYLVRTGRRLTVYLAGANVESHRQVPWREAFAAAGQL